MDIYSLLMTISSLSASFVAILGGFIVSRLITINSERSLYAGQLQEVTGQLIYYRGVRNISKGGTKLQRRLHYDKNG